MTTTLLGGGRVRTGRAGQPLADWVLLDGQTVVGVGPADDVPGADRSISLEGATVVPGFCDAHVHLPGTGLFLTAVDLDGLQTPTAVLSALRARAERGDALVLAVNLRDRDGSLHAADVDAAVGATDAVVAQSDIHSCVVSSSLLRKLELGAVDGVDRDDVGSPTGRLRERAAAVVWRWLDANTSTTAQADAVKAAADRAYSQGVVSVHEMFVAEWRGWSALDPFLEVVSGLALEVVVYPASDDVAMVAEMGFDRVGGDLFLDGSIGSHTAWLQDPYEVLPPRALPACGMSYRSDEDVAGFFREAQSRGMQTGVHAIGDAAIEQALSAWEKVAAEVGSDAIRARRHRIEHFELCSREHIERAAALGLCISVQPAFDALWGGSEGMYASRLGWDRASTMNPFRSMLDAGLHVGSGSDTPVTPIDPLGSIAALRDHHVPEQSLSGNEALWVQTAGARALAGKGPDGTFTPGGRADLAVLDVDPVTDEAAQVRRGRVLATFIGGQQVWPEAEREAE